MAKFKSIMLVNGNEYIYEAEEPTNMIGLNDKSEHVRINEDPIVMTNSKITKLSFLNRFTNEELGAFYTFVSQDIGMQILEKKLMAAMFVDLKDYNTIYAVNVLRAASVLQSDLRVSQVLNTIPSESELYNG